MQNISLQTLHCHWQTMCWSCKYSLRLQDSRVGILTRPAGNSTLYLTVRTILLTDGFPVCIMRPPTVGISIFFTSFAFLYWVFLPSLLSFKCYYVKSFIDSWLWESNFLTTGIDVRLDGIFLFVFFWFTLIMLMTAWSYLSSDKSEQIWLV